MHAQRSHLVAFTNIRDRVANFSNDYWPPVVVESMRDKTLGARFVRYQAEHRNEAS